MKIAALWIERLWRTKQSPSRRFYTRAIAEHEDVELVVTGPGFPNWDNKQSGWENLSRILPGVDAVINYKALAGCEFGKVNDPQEIAENCVTVEQFNECWPGIGNEGTMHSGAATAAGECIKGHIRLAIIHHENDRWRMKQAEEAGVTIRHIPHCASDIFLKASLPWDEREGAVLTGSVGAEHYPLRQRMRELIDKGAIPFAINVQRPPNYTKSIEQSDSLVQNYAETLGRAKVKLGCSSKWKYGLQHYTEAAMAGCAHVADIPDNFSQELGASIYSISMDSTDDEIVETIKNAYEHGEMTARTSQEVAKKDFTLKRYANDMLACIQELR